MFKLKLHNETVKLIRNLHPQLKRKVRSALQLISTDPYIGKTLRDELEGMKSFRIGRMRIVYRISRGKYVEIVTIGPRHVIYEETLRLIRKQD